jgi:L-rhamnose-H+ transport protein
MLIDGSSVNYALGFTWLVLGGVPQGAFALPMKFIRGWKWEHLWLVYSVLAFFVLPTALALFTVPALGTVYASSSIRILLVTAAFGAGWGLGSVFFGLGIDALGMALGYSMMTGIYTALGAFVPLAVLTPDLVWTRKGILIIIGNLVSIAGVAVSAVAGDMRAKQSSGRYTQASLNKGVSFRVGLLICVAGGVFSAMINFCYAFGSPISEMAQHFGASKDTAVNALWLIGLPSGGILNVAYCVYKIQRHRKWPVLWHSATSWNWLNASLMAVLWTGSTIIYGWGANALGRLGPSLGWSFYNAILIITTVVCGLLTHEWDEAKGLPLRMLLIGIALLVSATLLLGMGGAGE